MPPFWRSRLRLTTAGAAAFVGSRSGVRMPCKWICRQHTQLGVLKSSIKTSLCQPDLPVAWRSTFYDHARNTNTCVCMYRDAQVPNYMCDTHGTQL